MLCALTSISTVPFKGKRDAVDGHRCRYTKILVQLKKKKGTMQEVQSAGNLFDFHLVSLGYISILFVL